MPSLNDALSYAHAGFKVLILYPIRNGVCACQELFGPPIAGVRHSEGKHPISRVQGQDICRHGVFGASFDPAVIQAWWTLVPDGSIGIRTGTWQDSAVWLVGDVDNADIAQRLLALFGDPANLPSDLANKYAVAKTRRGCHLWMRVQANTPTLILSTDNGEKIGELRGEDAYVVVPPSKFIPRNGPDLEGEYEWVYGDIRQQPPEPHRTDGLTAFRKALTAVGETIRDPNSRTTRRLAGQTPSDPSAPPSNDPPPIVPIPCPFSPFGDPELEHLLSGLSGALRVDRDRSHTLYDLAHHLVNHANAINYPITPEEVAGVLKHTDAIEWQKFSNRSNGDWYYYSDALDAIAHFQEKQQQRTTLPKAVQQAQAIANQPQLSLPSGTPSNAPGVRLPIDPNAVYGLPDDLDDDDDGSGSFWSGGGGSASGGGGGGPQPLYTYANGYLRRGKTLLANFRPVIATHTRIVIADAALDEGEEYECTLEIQHPSGSTTVKFPNNALESEQTIRARIARALPHDRNVFPGGWGHLWPAANFFSPKTSILYDEAYGRTGWNETDHGAAFILPGAEGGITAYGVDKSIRFHGFPPNTPDRYSLYGVGVRPVQDQAERDEAGAAFLDVLTLAPPVVMLPVVMQILAGPLTSLGLDASSPLVHLCGETGSFKTSIAVVVCSLFGAFVKPSPANGARRIAGSTVTESWESTNAVLQHTVYLLRDLTAIIDDYKIMQKNVKLAGLFVQNYGNRTSRNRMTTRQERLQALSPAGLVLSTGENRFDEDDPSVAARTYHVGLPEGTVVRVGNAFPQLTNVQDHAERLVLARVGGTFLQWLARQGLDNVRKAIDVVRKQEREALDHEQGMHNRLIDVLAVSWTVERLVRAFLQDEFPAIVADFDRLVADEHQNALLRAVEAQQHADEGKAVSQVLRRLAERLTAIESHGTNIKLVRRGRNETRYVGHPTGTIVGYYDDAFIYLTQNSTFKWFTREDRDTLFDWTTVTRQAKEELGGIRKLLKEYGAIASIRIPLHNTPLAGRVPEDEVDTWPTTSIIEGFDSTSGSAAPSEVDAL